MTNTTPTTRRPRRRWIGLLILALLAFAFGVSVGDNGEDYTQADVDLAYDNGYRDGLNVPSTTVPPTTTIPPTQRETQSAHAPWTPDPAFTWRPVPAKVSGDKWSFDYGDHVDAIRATDPIEPYIITGDLTDYNVPNAVNTRYSSFGALSLDDMTPGNTVCLVFFPNPGQVRLTPVKLVSTHIEAYYYEHNWDNHPEGITGYALMEVEYADGNRRDLHLIDQGVTPSRGGSWANRRYVVDNCDVPYELGVPLLDESNFPLPPSETEKEIMEEILEQPLPPENDVGTPPPPDGYYEA